MKKILRIAVVAVALGFMVIPDLVCAQYGIRRRTHRRTAVVVGHTAKAAGASQAAAAQQQTAAAQQQPAAANQRADAAEKEAAAARQDAAIARGLLPFGTVAPTLPAGCVATAVGGVEYHRCGVNYYRAVFQGNNLVYVTTALPN